MPNQLLDEPQELHLDEVGIKNSLASANWALVLAILASLYLFLISIALIFYVLPILHWASTVSMKAVFIFTFILMLLPIIFLYQYIYNTRKSIRIKDEALFSKSFIAQKYLYIFYAVFMILWAIAAWSLIK